MASNVATSSHRLPWALSPGWLALGLGLTAGLLFGGDVISWLITLWRAHMLPAFMEINASGIPLCA